MGNASFISASPDIDLHPDTASLANYRRTAAGNRLGLWLFMFSDAFLFGGLYVARFYLLGTETRPEVNQFVGLVVTAVLLTSSFFANRAEVAASFGNTRTFNRSILITIALGVLFLVGVVGVEWQITPYGPSESSVYSLFYTMTGFHALHVLTGVIFLMIVWRNARKGLYTAERHWPVEAAIVYWHFIDVVWVFFYPALYLIGHPPL